MPSSSLRHRFEGALLQALIAVSATAKRKYPKETDRQSFEHVLRDARTWRLSVEYRGEQHPIERLLYEWVRCEMVHAGGLPVDLEVMPSLDPGEMTVRSGGEPHYVLKLSHGWFHHLLDVVKYDPINADLFPSPSRP